MMCVSIFSGGLCSISVFTKTEGDDLSFGCFFNSSQSPKFFVKEHAKEKIILETRGVRAQKGKYSINYDTEFNVFYVKITQLDQSDSGRYRCGLGNASCPQSEREFEVRVTDGEFLFPNSELHVNNISASKTTTTATANDNNNTHY